jgi:hypothetical protein
MTNGRIARLVLALSALSFLASTSLTAQAATPLPSKKPVAQVYLKVNEPYFLDAFKADIDRLESGMTNGSGQAVKLSSKNKLGILLDSIDMILFRQYCDREGIAVSDADVSSQITQLKAQLGPNASDAQVEANLRRSGVFMDVRAYVKQDMLFTAYLRAKKADAIKAIGNPSAEDVIKAYDDMKFNLRRPTSYRISMLVARVQGKSDADKAKARDQMKDIAAKVKADPAAFDGYLVKGLLGIKDLPYQSALGAIIAKTPESKKQYPALYDAVFKLKEGETSDCIEDDNGLIVLRVSQYIPEKQLAIDDSVDGLIDPKAAGANSSMTVLNLVVNDMQNSKYAALNNSARTEIIAKLRKEGNVTVNLSSLAGILDEAELATIKGLKGSGYSISVQ